MSGSSAEEALNQTVDALQQRITAWRRARLGPRGLLLYVLPAPLALTAIIELAKGEWRIALASAAAFAAVVLGARINRRALREVLLASGPRFTPPPRVPLKWRAAALVGLGTAIAAAFVVGHGAVSSALFAGLSVLGFHLGYDLRAVPTAASVHPEVARDAQLRKIINRAEARILVLEAAAETVGNAELRRRLGVIASRGRDVLGVIAERPEQAYRARKMLSVYLDGAQRVASRYARTHRLARSAELEQNFVNVLSQIETVFETQTAELARRDAEDLDIHIEVLRKRMRSEGIV